MKTVDLKPTGMPGQARNNLTEYGRRRLLTYADTFNELAKSMEGEFIVESVPYSLMPRRNSIGPESGSAEQVSESAEWVDGSMGQTNGGAGQIRDGVLQNRRIWESRQVVSSNLQQAARIMTRAAAEVFQIRSFEGKKKKILVRAFRAEGIVLTDLYYVDRPGERSTLVASLQLAQGDKNKDHLLGRDAVLAADLLSVVLNKRLQLSVASPGRIEKEVHDFVFVEEAAFLVMSGTARAVKEGESLSGDNFSLIESEKGRLTALLSDGMGSGEKACQDSELILDLMEKMLESGCLVEEAVKMVNGSLIAGAERQNMSTLDICDLDLYAGVAQFLKIGASATFLKRGDKVEIIENHSLPMGIFQSMEPLSIKRSLMDGDYVIMMTDGVLDALKKSQYEETMRRIIQTVKEQNPKEIASRILQFALHLCGGCIQDDMTVLVLGVWENISADFSCKI